MGSNSYRPRIAITMGDPNGVGPEVALKSLADSRMFKFFRPVLIGSKAVYDVHQAKLGLGDIKLKLVEKPGDDIWDDEEFLPVVDLPTAEGLEVHLDRKSVVEGTGVE